jgi:hypothetical protein
MRIITARFLATVCSSLILASIALISDTLAQTDPTREVQARHAECNALEKSGTKYEFQGNRETETRSAWQKFDPKASDFYEFMRVYVGGNRVRSVRLEASSASGDWSSVTTYCYRSTGTLAFQFQTLRTFLHSQEGTSVLEVELRSYFSPNGKNFKNLEKMMDSQSKKILKTDYMKMPAPSFPTSSIVKEIGATLLSAK